MKSSHVAFEKWWNKFFHSENQKMDWHLATYTAFLAGYQFAKNEDKMTPEEPEDTYGSDDDESSGGQEEDTNSDDWNNDYDEDEARYGDDRDD